MNYVSSCACVAACVSADPLLLLEMSVNAKQSGNQEEHHHPASLVRYQYRCSHTENHNITCWGHAVSPQATNTGSYRTRECILSDVAACMSRTSDCHHRFGASISPWHAVVGVTTSSSSSPKAFRCSGTGSAASSPSVPSSKAP